MRSITRLLFMTSLLLQWSFSAADPAAVNTDWIPSKPEMLTYKTTSEQGDGYYQVTLTRTASGVEVYLNIIANGFTKTISSWLTPELHPVRSSSRIHVNGQISMETECQYGKEKLHIATLMKPYNRTMENDLPVNGMVLDFAQTPFMARVLPLRIGAAWTFSSVNPQTNTLVPFTLKVVGEETVGGTDCFKVEEESFEGRSIAWVEKQGNHRILRIEQPEAGRVSTLIP